MKTTFLMKCGVVALVVLSVLVACNRDEITDRDLFPSEETSQIITFTSELIPGSYIIELHKDALPAGLRSAGMSYAQRQQVMNTHALEMMAKHKIDATKLLFAYSTSIQGFALSDLSDADVKRLTADPAVKAIEQDQTVSLQGGPPGGGGGSCANGTSEVIPCGVSDVGGGDTYNGSNKAYVLDTGIDLTHPDLNVNAGLGFNAFTSGQDAGSLNDLNGHGSHVSGTIAAKANGIGVVGVAAGATVIPVKVLNRQGSGSISGVIAGVNYVGGNAANGDVANMSLTSGVSSALDNAVVAASNGGVWFALAAGNNGANANNYSPARANGNFIRTVSAMNCSGAWASFSNFANPPVDYCAPGVSTCSTSKNGGYASLSGTSMATPHVSGILLATGGSPSTCGTVTGDPSSPADVIACIN